MMQPTDPILESASDGVLLRESGNAEAYVWVDEDILINVGE